MANASKNKGKAYERVVANHLSIVTSLNFERVPNSGAFVGGKNSFRTSTLSKEQVGMFEGDIITPKEWNHVRIECKWYKDFCWHQLFDPEGEPTLNKWIEQAEQGTRPYWFLCFKINRAGEFVVYDGEKLGELLGSLPNKLLYKVLKKDGYSKKFYYIVSMTNFFEINKVTILNLNNQETSNDTDIRNEQTK